MSSSEPPVGPAPVNGRRLILIAAGVLLAVVVGLLVPVPSLGRLGEAAGDLVHAPLFAGLTLGIYFLLERISPTDATAPSLVARILPVVCLVLLFATATEFAQGLFGRTTKLHDAMANGLGVLAATLCYLSWRLGKHRSGNQRLGRVLLASAVVPIAFASWSPLSTLQDMLAVYQNFPDLASFESPKQLSRFYFRDSSAHLTRRDATGGNFAAEITYQPTSHASVTLVELSPNWSDVSTLELDVILDAAYAKPSVRFSIKVIDQSHANWDSDVFGGVWVLEPGKPRHIRISRRQLIDGPEARKLDLANIQFVAFGLLDSDQIAKLRVDSLRLTLSDDDQPDSPGKNTGL